MNQWMEENVVHNGIYSAFKKGKSNTCNMDKSGRHCVNKISQAQNGKCWITIFTGSI